MRNRKIELKFPLNSLHSITKKYTWETCKSAFFLSSSYSLKTRIACLFNLGCQQVTENDHSEFNTVFSPGQTHIMQIRKRWWTSQWLWFRLRASSVILFKNIVSFYIFSSQEILKRFILRFKWHKYLNILFRILLY